MAGGGGSSRNSQTGPVNTQPGLPVAIPGAMPTQPGNTAQTGVINSTNPSIFDQSAAGLSAAGLATAGGLGYRPNTLAGTNYAPYESPYTSSVVDASLGDIDRQRQMALNGIGASATAAGAFGGSRHGVAEAETNRAAMQQSGLLGSQLRNQGFQNAQNAAMFDINSQMAGNQQRLGAAGQLAGIAGQGYGIGQDINTRMSAQGAMQQGLQQQLIDAARAQYGGFTGAPGQSLQYPLAALSAAPNVQTQTSTKTPGLFDFLSLGLGLL